MYVTTLCLVITLIGIVLAMAIVVNALFDNDAITAVAIFLTLGVLGYIFQYLNIILVDLLEQFQLYYLSK